MATLERIEVRVDAEFKATANRAATLSGKSTLSDYIKDLIRADATKVIAEHDKFTLEGNIFDRFMDACTNAAQPNEALQNANTLAKEQGIT